DKLTELERNTGCCSVTVGPEDLTEKRTLQTIVDQYRAALRIGTRVTICLRPGVYELRAPLRLGHDHSGIAIEGCHDGAVLHAAAVTVEDCLFRYSLSEGRHVFGAAIFAGSECWGLHITDNEFVMEEDYLRHEGEITRLLYGYVLAPTVTVSPNKVIKGADAK